MLKVNRRLWEEFDTRFPGLCRSPGEFEWFVEHHKDSSFTDKMFCPICGGRTPFHGKWYPGGYSEFCGWNCSRKISIERSRKTILLKHGVTSPNQIPGIKEKTIQTNMKRYGCENPIQHPDIKLRVKQSNLEKYGVEHPMQTEEGLLAYKAGMQKTFGVDFPYQSPTIVKALQDRSIEENGTQWPIQTEKARKNCAEARTEGVKEAQKQTMLATYGREFASQVPSIRRKMKEGWVKSRKGNRNTSKEQKYIGRVLRSIFPNMVENGLDLRYSDPEGVPWEYDFYIPNLDLFIEYQGYYSHGGCPYDPENDEHQALLFQWQQKGWEGNIHVWTVSDPLKRETARKNGLNWLEFFSIQQVKDWLFSVSPDLMYKCKTCFWEDNHPTCIEQTGCTNWEPKIRGVVS